MSENSMTRMLELIARELMAKEAKVEYGGGPPSDPSVLWAPLPGGWRVVAHFVEPPADAKQLSLKLRQLTGAFFEIPPQHPLPDRQGHVNWTTRRLDDELCGLAARTGAVSAIVVDFQSPVLWGTSEPRIGDESIELAERLTQLAEMAERGGMRLLELCSLDPDRADTLLNQAETLNEGSKATLRRELVRLRALDPTRRLTDVLTCRAMTQVRRARNDDAPASTHFREVVHQEDFGYLARSFASIYVLTLVFKNAYSELHAEAALLHALPVIERLVLALPPVDPPSKGGQVVKLPVPASDR